MRSPAAALTAFARRRVATLPTTRIDRILFAARWVAIFVWLGFLLHECLYEGLPFDREGLLLWISLGLLAASIGRRPLKLVWVAIDFLPLALVLIAYDLLRGMSDKLGMPTWWRPQVDADRFLFFGHEPTVWLQAHLKHAYPDVPWYGVLVTLCYFSFFFLPYVTAGVLWLRSRKDFYRWSFRFVGLSFLGFALFALVPAAPPWAAALCGPGDIASHPNNPSCMWDSSPAHIGVIQGGILGPMNSHLPGANPWIERNSGWGLNDLHLTVAHSLVDKGHGIADAVAAMPSLHLGGTMLFVLFMWPRLHRWWRPLLVAYPVAMTFSLVYSAEHYVVDCVAGALCAVLIMVVAGRIERWHAKRREARGGAQVASADDAEAMTVVTQR